jgi:hypothetical protein
LASVIYGDELDSEEARVTPDRALRSRSLAIDLPYVKSAQIIDGAMHDFPTQTLLIDFIEPLCCLSSLAGSLSGVATVGNNCLSPPLWNTLHAMTVEALKQTVCRIAGRDAARSSFLYTGARMDNLSVQKMKHDDMIVYALVTAGVTGNAMRASIDEGRFGELIAKAVYRGVRESIALQNGLAPGRSIFQRLSERRIDLQRLVTECGKFSLEDGSRMLAGLETLLMNPLYAGFMESALAVSNDYGAGLVSDLRSFQELCRHTSEAISGCKSDTWIRFAPDDFASKPICMAFDALLNGLYLKKAEVVGTLPELGECAK